MQTQELPYGAPMGAGIVLSPNLPNNTLIVASVGNPRFHVLPIMGSVMVETDRSFAFDRDETNVRATIYCQSVVQNKMAFAVFTGTNNFTE